MSRRFLTAFLLVFFLSPAAATDDQEKRFWEAARKGDDATVKALLEKGVDVNTPFLYGATALSYACDRGHLEVVKVLLQHDANVNAKDTFYGVTPLDRALQRGHTAVVKLLLENGAEGSDQVLSTGAVEGKKEMVKIVLEKGGTSRERLTLALALANENGHVEVAELLREAGAVPPVELAPEKLGRYAGTYQDANGEEVTFTVEGSKLHVSGDGWGPLELLALDEGTMIFKQFAAAPFLFHLEGDKVTGVTVERRSGESSYQKLKSGEKEP